MGRRTPTPKAEVVAAAVLDLAGGMEFSDALTRWGIGSDHIFTRIFRHDHRQKFVRDIRRSRQIEQPCARNVEEIVMDEERRRKLFVMDERHIAEHYALLAEGKENRLPNGTFLHDSNIGILVYRALAYHNPELGTGDRTAVIERLGEITRSFQEYLEEIRLGGLTVMKKNRNGKGINHLDILKYYDRQFRKRFGKPSIFDLNVQPHLHEWGETSIGGGAVRKAGNGYFTMGRRRMKKARIAVYHTLTEEYPALSLEGAHASANGNTYKKRDEIISAFEGIEGGLFKAFSQLGLGGLMMVLGEQGKYVRKVIEIYDIDYQKATGDLSLMDQSAGRYMKCDTRGRIVRPRKQQF